MRDCPWYDRGFCRHGPSCRHRHVRRVLCLNYLAGFCPAGPECPDAHPRFELPVPGEFEGRKMILTCHFCGEPGHKLSQCPTLPDEMRDQQQMSGEKTINFITHITNTILIIKGIIYCKVIFEYFVVCLTNKLLRFHCSGPVF